MDNYLIGAIFAFVGTGTLVGIFLHSSNSEPTQSYNSHIDLNKQAEQLVINHFKNMLILNSELSLDEAILDFENSHVF